MLIKISEIYLNRPTDHQTNRVVGIKPILKCFFVIDSAVRVCVNTWQS